MKKLYFVLAMVTATFAFAQQGSKKPLVLIDGMLASAQLVESDKKNVASTNTYNTAAKLPQNLKTFESLAAQGITNVKVKENYYDRITLAELNTQFKLSPANPVYFDGHIITNTDLVILGNVLEHVELGKYDGQEMLTISTTPRATSASALK